MFEVAGRIYNKPMFKHLITKMYDGKVLKKSYTGVIAIKGYKDGHKFTMLIRIFDKNDPSKKYYQNKFVSLSVNGNQIQGFHKE